MPFVPSVHHCILQLHEAPLVTDMKVLNKSLEHVDVVGLLYDSSAQDSFRFAADLYVSVVVYNVSHFGLAVFI